ncbi:MAG: ComEC/Rec2 family competence protein [Planctomycetota bacterium]|nr:MAG: ComEC/Rec2 family competence protein [Planctomycetota bacterium]
MPPLPEGVSNLVGRVPRLCAAAMSLLPPIPAGWWRREPLPTRPLVVVAAALAVGTALAILLPLPALACWGVALGALLAWTVLAGGGSTAAGLLLLVAVASSSAAWTSAQWRLFPADDLAWSLGDLPVPLVVEGSLLESPRELPRSADPLRGGSLPPTSECLLAVAAVRDGESWRPVSGRAVVIVDGPPSALPVGARLRVWGRGLRPGSPGNPGEFDQRARARGARCLSVIRVPGEESLEIVALPAWPTGVGLLDRLRAGGALALANHVSPARAPLASKLVLGTREGLAAGAIDAFMVTGTVHILSISGLHVALLAGALVVIARLARLPRGPALVAVAVLTGLYMLLVGAETPVLRATLLVWLACLGGATGRRSPGINALAVAAIIVLAWHPPELFRIGSQLSFLSTAVLIGAATAVASGRRNDDPIARLIDHSRGPVERWLRRRGCDIADAVLVGAAVWLATAPLVAGSFHVASPVGLLLNPLIAPLVGLAMVGGFVCLALSPVCVPLAAIGGAVCDASLAVIDVVVRQAAGIPGAFAWVSGPPGWWIAGWYIGMLAILLLVAGPRLVRPFTWAGAAAAWACVGLLVTVLPGRTAPALETVIAAMGHGCGIVIRGPGGGCLVYDAGRLGAGIAAGRGLSAVLWSEGIERIDTLVISHADTDHFNGVPDLIERFAVGSVVVPEAFLKSESPAVTEILRRINQAGIAVTVGRKGDEIPFDGLCRVRVLHPRRATVEGDEARGRGPTDNESSLVVAVESAGRRILLTGDLEGGALDRFVAEGPGRCDVLIAPHHGSLASLPPALARVTAPEWVVVSGAAGPRFEEVRRAYESAAGADHPARVLRTEGAVRLRLTAAGTQASQFRNGRWRPVDPAPTRGPLMRVSGDQGVRDQGVRDPLGPNAGMGSRHPTDAVEIHHSPRLLRMGEDDHHIVSARYPLPGRVPLVELLPLPVDLHRNGCQEGAICGVEMQFHRSPRSG